MRSLVLSALLGAISLGLIGLTPSDAQAQRWRWSSYYSPTYVYPTYTSSYYAPDYTAYYPTTSYYVPATSYYYPTPVYSSYYYPSYTTTYYRSYYPRRYYYSTPGMVTYSAYPAYVYP